jgi:hypothetical protein
MKNSISLALSLCFFLFCSVSIFAQDNDSTSTINKKKVTLKVDKSKVKVQRHTVMSRFEPEIASTEQARMEKRQKRIAETEYKLRVLDTLDISERKRRMLLRDLKYTPYSNRLNKAVIVDTKLEDDDSKDQ